MKKNRNIKQALLLKEKMLFESQIIERHTGKPIDEVLNNSSVIELIRLNAYVDFLRSV